MYVVFEGNFNVGDKVYCRDRDDQEWQEGIVTSVDPVKVLPKTWKRAQKWKQVRSTKVPCIP